MGHSLLKLITIEILHSLGDGRFEVSGRNCRESICVGDFLQLAGSTVASSMQVEDIEVYRRSVRELFRGYVGTLRVQVLAGPAPQLGAELVGD
jgi:hypothetical protein